MIIDGEMVNKCCHKKLNIFHYEKIKIEDENVIINIELNDLNNTLIYNDILKNSLPKNLKILEINSPIIHTNLIDDVFNYLPDTIEEIIFRNVSGIAKKLPKELKKLDAKEIRVKTLGEKLEEASVFLMTEIPKSLKKLDIDKWNNDSENIEYLNIDHYEGGKFNDALIELNIYNSKNIKDLKHLKKLKKLILKCDNYDILDRLPNNLEHFDYEFYNFTVSWCENNEPILELNNFPPKLKTLKLKKINSDLNFLPEIETLELSNVDGKFENLPSSIKYLSYDGYETIINESNLTNLIKFDKKMYKKIIYPKYDDDDNWFF